MGSLNLDLTGGTNGSLGGSTTNIKATIADSIANLVRQAVTSLLGNVGS